MRRVATELWVLLPRGSTRGYIDLVRPLTFEEQLEDVRTIRDAEEECVVCVRCSSPSTGPRCDEYLREHREATNASRAIRRAANLCIFCGGPFPCEACSKAVSLRTSKLRARRRANGMCEICNIPAVAGGYCVGCRAVRLPKAAAREACKRAVRRVAGLCTSCGRQSPELGGTTCAACRERARLSKAARSTRRRLERENDTPE